VETSTNVYNFVHLALILSLPCEICKSYIGSLQQSDDIRNNEATAEKVSKAAVFCAHARRSVNPNWENSK